jgi:hypothetical protein
LKKKNIILRKAATISLFLMLIYVLTMLMISTIIVDNPQLIFRGQVSAQIIDPFEDLDKNMSERFNQFEGFVMIASATEESGYDLHLTAFPGIRSQIYRNYVIHIFANQPCYYEIKVDEQLLERGVADWRTQIKSSSPYNTINIQVKLVNETNATLPVFYFNELALIDTPWDAVDDEDKKPVIEEWIRMSRGDFTMWVIRNIIMQILFGFMGAVGGINLALIHADFRAIERKI